MPKSEAQPNPADNYGKRRDLLESEYVACWITDGSFAECAGQVQGITTDRRWAYVRVKLAEDVFVSGWFPWCVVAMDGDGPVA